MKSSVLLTAEAGKCEEEEHDDKQFALEEVFNKCIDYCAHDIHKRHLFLSLLHITQNMHRIR